MFELIKLVFFEKSTQILNLIPSICSKNWESCWTAANIPQVGKLIVSGDDYVQKETLPHSWTTFLNVQLQEMLRFHQLQSIKSAKDSDSGEVREPTSKAPTSENQSFLKSEVNAGRRCSYKRKIPPCSAKARSSAHFSGFKLIWDHLT